MKTGKMKKRMVSALLVAGLATSLYATAFATPIQTTQDEYDYSYTKYGDYTDEYPLGTANKLEGKTLIVSIFADDADYQWDLNSSKDQETIFNIKKYMGIATDYLTDVAADYGKSAEFTYDFTRNTDLAYHATLDINTGSEYTDYAIGDYIDQNIDTEALKEKYGADNIVYFMFVNSDENCKAISCTRNYYEGMPYPYEVVFLYNVDSGCVNPPAVYAHEILHTFGMPDLYMEDSEYNITSDFLTYVEENLSNDLMYTCSDLNTGDYDYDEITNTVSDLDAYYVGLTDHCDLAEQAGLNPSQHVSQN